MTEEMGCTMCGERSIGLCGLCDELYCVSHAARHEHPEPQSGMFRDHWLESGLPYIEWIASTDVGRLWYQDTGGNR